MSCDRCPAIAVWSISFSCGLGLLMCNHHYEMHRDVMQEMCINVEDLR